MRRLLLFLLWPVALLAQSHPYTTNFPATENPISQGGLWLNGAADGTSWGNVRTTPGLAFGTVVSGAPPFNDSTAVLKGTWAANQSASAVVHLTNGSDTDPQEEVELRLNTSITAGSITGYEFDYSVKSGTPYVVIVRWNGTLNSFCYINTGSTCTTPNLVSVAVHDGDVLSATNVNGLLTAYVNGVVAATATDTTYTNGSPGIGFWDEGGSTGDLAHFGFSSFSASDSVWTGILSPVGTGNCTTLAPNQLPAPCAIAWQGNAGIPGGVPVATQSGSTITSTGSDQTSAINSALTSCGGSSGSQKFIQLATGTFQISSSLIVPSFCELRGTAANLTVVNTNSGTYTQCEPSAGDGDVQAICLGNGGLSYTPLTISSGATAGSTILTLGSTTGVTVGGDLVISETNASYVTNAGGEGVCTWCDGAWASGNRSRGQIVEVQSIVGSVVTISPGLYTDYTNTPTAVGFTPTKSAGVRDLQVVGNNNGLGSLIGLNKCAYCYVKGVEGNYADNDFVNVAWGYRDEVRDSYFTNGFVHTSGSFDTNVDVFFKTSGTLIENNIIERAHVGIMLEWGSAGNVISYNYIQGEFNIPSANNAVLAGINYHGAHPQFNLIEGNVAPQFRPDEIWGSSSHTATNRNWWQGTTTVCNPLTGRSTVNCTPIGTPSGVGVNGWHPFQESIGLAIDHLSWYTNTVGDISGSAAQQALITTTGSGTSHQAILNWTSAACAASGCRSFDITNYNFTFGFGEAGDDGTGTGSTSGCSGGTTGPCHSVDAFLTSTLYKSYTFSNTTSNCLSGGGAGTCTASLPASFYLAAKPSWWTSGIPFPAIGPDVTGGTGPGGHTSLTASNPAQNCYLNTMGGSEGGPGSPLSFNEATCYATNNTWYIRPDGGSATQCTGLVNAAYPGSGSAQACAFNHPYWMIASNGISWTSFIGGDTMQFVSTSGHSDTYFTGEQNAGVGVDWNANGLSSICAPPNPGQANGAACIMPAPPSGTAGAHTKILGQNVGSCHDSAHTHLVNPTILSGIAGAFSILDLRSTNYVDISCIAVTQPDTCTTVGNGTGMCGNFSNFVHFGGLVVNYLTGAGASNLTVTDFAAAGIGSQGILGSNLNVTGGGAQATTCTDCYVIGNGGAGWSGDGGGCNTSCESIGTLNLHYNKYAWNGCVAVNYDFTKSYQLNSYNFCMAQQQGAFANGDGFVQIAAGNLTLNIDHSEFSANVQDGLDALHLSDDLTTSPAVNISTSWAGENMGQNFKIGAGASSSAMNNVSVGDCRALTIDANYPLNPSGWSTGNQIPGDACRASGGNWVFALKAGSTITIQNNTTVSYDTTTYNAGCISGTTCITGGTKAVGIFQNNVTYALADPGNGGQFASGWFLPNGDLFANSGGAASFNDWYQSRTGCPDPSLTTEANFLCTNPGFIAASVNANGTVITVNPNITSSSSVYHAGTTIGGITTDYNGTARPPFSMGAFEAIASATFSRVRSGNTVRH